MSKSRAKVPRQRKQSKQLSWSSSSDEEELIIDQPSDPVQDAESSDKTENDVLESFKEMSEDEMAQHLKLCMKLSAENKINVKNAFGLRLIDLLNKIVNKPENADLQTASLSLQASSKIYAGRVEALYQDTMKFHSHLQSIVSGGKKEKKKNLDDDMIDDNEDAADNKKSKPKSKCKSFIKSEETLTMEQDISSQAAREPHANFKTINAAFSTSRFAPRLLSNLQLSDDSCMLRCATSELCYKPRNPVTNQPYEIPPKLKVLFGKIKNFNVAHSSIESFSESTGGVSSAPFISTPKPTAPPPLFDDDDDDGFAAAPDPFQDDAPGMIDPADDVNSVESAIEKFDVLNITADTFVNDIAAAITDQGVDHRLLPPNSVLKKMLDKSKRSSIRPSTVGKSTKRKVKEPFFAGKSAEDVKSLFVKGRSTTVSQKIVSEWNIEKTSNIDLQYEFIEELESKKEYEDSSPTLDDVLNVIKQNDPQYHFKYYFNKMSQVWKFSRRKLCVSNSFVGTPGANQTEKRVGSLAPTDPEALAASFQNLSLHDSIPNIPDSPASAVFDNSNNDLPGIIDTDEAEFVIPPESFEADIEDLMVKPPELVRPTSMKFEKRPVNLNTEKIKDLLSVIITSQLELNTHTENGIPYVLFSEVYEELKNKLEKEISEFISMQFTFVVLLILANQKTLLIENLNDNSDLSIKQDVSEIDITDNM